MSEDFAVVCINLTVGVAALNLKHAGQSRHAFLCTPKAAHAQYNGVMVVWQSGGAFIVASGDRQAGND
jgi:hypothetical protein